jgi:hypothetical protein
VSSDRDTNEEGFFRRWSRVKSEAREDTAAPPVAPAPQPQSKADSGQPEPELPSLDQLTIDSDFSGFFHPKVDEGVRRQALRKLFSDPHFNVMDGLDVYIDDYSKSEPIPAAMLAGLKQAQRILECAAQKPEEKQPHALASHSTDDEQQVSDGSNGQLAANTELAVPLEPTASAVGDTAREEAADQSASHGSSRSRFDSAVDPEPTAPEPEDEPARSARTDA